MLKEQHMRRVEEALLEAIRAAEVAGLSGTELQMTLATLLNIEE